MERVDEIRRLIAQLTRDRGQRPTFLEMHPDYFDAVVTDMRRSRMPITTIGKGVVLDGVSLFASSRVKELNERANAAEQPQ